MNPGMARSNFNVRSPEVSHEVLTPARSGIRGSSSFASIGGFPESGVRLNIVTKGGNMVMKRTTEVIRNPDIYTDMLSEMICNNPWIRQSEAKYVGEENDCFWLFRGVAWRWGKVIRADH